MVRLDHLSLPVADWQKSRDWYRRHLGFEVEFEIPDRQTAAMRDDADLTVFLYQAEVAPCPGISFTIQVDDVDAKHRELSAAGTLSRGAGEGFPLHFTIPKKQGRGSRRAPMAGSRPAPG